MYLSGSITALATPFAASGELDFDAWRRHLRNQLDAGTQAVVVAGSTGEANALSDAEYDALLQVAVVHLPVLHVAFGTVPLSLDQWLFCVAMGSAVLWVSEMKKWAGRLLARPTEKTPR